LYNSPKDFCYIFIPHFFFLMLFRWFWKTLAINIFFFFFFQCRGLCYLVKWDKLNYYFFLNLEWILSLKSSRIGLNESQDWNCSSQVQLPEAMFLKRKRTSCMLRAILIILHNLLTSIIILLGSFIFRINPCR